MLSPRRRVVITGTGMVSPLGHCVASSWQRLMQGSHTGTIALPSQVDRSTNAADVRLLHNFFPKHLHSDMDRMERILRALSCKVIAPVTSINNKEVKDPLASTSRCTRHQLFAERAAAEALLQSGLLSLPELTLDQTIELLKKESSNMSKFWNFNNTTIDHAPSRRGVNVGVGMNSLNDIADANHHVYGGGGTDAPPRLNRIEPFFVPKILTNTVSGALAMSYNLCGPNQCTSTACATGAHCIGDAARWIQYGDADLVVCGATEAAITPVGIAGFARMKAVATKFNDTPATASRPFDASRGGFIMGEGAGILVLEEMESAQRRGANILCEIVGYGMSGDAHHVSSPHPSGRGAAQAMTNALADARRCPSGELSKLVPHDICHLNAHATSTPMGDEIELAAAARVLRPVDSESSSSISNKLIVSSIKGHIGHLLGAAGAVETIFAVQSLIDRRAPLTANLETPLELDDDDHHHNDGESSSSSRRLLLVSENKEPSIELTPREDTRDLLVMCNSFGFGGTNASLLLRKCFE